MERQQQYILVQKSPEDVFAFMDDIEREPEWQPNLQEAEQTPPGATRVGTRKRYVSTFLKKQVENTYEVVELEPGRRVLYKTVEGSAVNAAMEVTCEAVAGGTLVTLSMEGEPAGPLRLVPGKLLEKAYREQLESTLERLKECLEA